LGLMVLEGSVYGLSTSCTWAEDHGGGGQLFTSWQTRSRHRLEDWGISITFKGSPHCLFPLAAQPPNISIVSKNSTISWDQVFKT
jgi:hypothetical protein